MYFSRTFKALNFDFQIQGLSRTFKVHANPARKPYVISVQMPRVSIYNKLKIESLNFGYPVRSHTDLFTNKHMKEPITIKSFVTAIQL